MGSKEFLAVRMPPSSSTSPCYSESSRSITVSRMYFTFACDCRTLAFNLIFTLTLDSSASQPRIQKVTYRATAY